MTQSPDHDAPLAEPEGVNAGSADGTGEAGPRDIAGADSGGDPAGAPDAEQGLTGYTATYGGTDDDLELVGTTDGEPSESGQDGGSME